MLIFYWIFGNIYHMAEKMIFPSANGVVVQCEDKAVVSMLNCSGQKRLRSFKNKNKVIFWHFPFVRGLQYFFCGLFAFFQTLITANDMCGTKPKKIKNLKKFYTIKLILLILIVLASVVVSSLVLGLLPGRLGWFLVGADGSTFLRNLTIMGFKVAIFYIILLAFRAFPAFSELLKFNRAGEILMSSEGRKKDKSVQTSPNFLNFLVFTFLLDFVVVTLIGAEFGFWFNLAFHVAIFLASMGVAYELLSLLQRFSATKWILWCTAFLVFEKPRRTHIELVGIALTEMNLLCTQKGREFMEDESKKAFAVVYLEVKTKLASAGIIDKSEVDWLIATILGKNRAEIKLLSFVSDKDYSEIMKATERRMKGESLDNIFGFTEFYGLRFDVNKKVLTPRMETELLVEQVLKAQKEYKNANILDLGTGSGAIAVAIAKNCDANITAVDVSKSALLTAEGNAKKNDVKIEFVQSNLFDGLKRRRKFDIIVSNPPYIPSKDIEKLDKNVRECDPVLALDGGEDGLDFYRQIIAQAKNRLNGGGKIFFEVGKGQAPAVRKILREHEFVEIKTIKDYNKIERIVCGKVK